MISDSYATTVISVRVDFCLSGFSEDPNCITQLLGIEPDEVRRTGETQKLPASGTVPVRENQWIRSSRSESKDVNAHFEELLSLLAGKEQLIDRAWSPSFSVLWKGNNLYAGSGPFYETGVVAGMARLGAALWQDIYQVVEP